jgi:hypothetical protein
VNKAVLTKGLPPDDLNAHFSKVANANTYDNAEIEQLLQSVDVTVDLDDYEPCGANCFAILLSSLKLRLLDQMVYLTGFTKHVHLS